MASGGMEVILGTMTIGGQADAAEGAAMLKAFSHALPAKLSTRLRIDTARMYQMPNRLTDATSEDDVLRSTESILGMLFSSQTAMEGRLHIATKANPWPEWDESLNASGVRRQLETSLAALGKDCVDLFYLHAPDNNTPIRETLQTVDGASTCTSRGFSHTSRLHCAFRQRFVSSAPAPRPLASVGRTGGLT